MNSFFGVMADFYRLKISDIYKETKDATVISFDVPKALYKIFSYHQGQHLTLKTLINGAEVRRTYSLCSSPLEKKWQVAIKKISGGLFSTFANTALKKDQIVEVMPPSGNFFVEVLPKASKNYIAFAAGSGITPILSIIKTHLEAEPHSSFKLFYLNKTVKSIMFKEEIEQLKNKYFKRFHSFYFLTQEQRDIAFLNGRFTPDKIKFLTQSFIDIEDTHECFICGPQQMTNMISDELQKLGLPKAKIHYELFFSGSTKEKNKKISEIIERKVEGTQVTIIDGGKEFHFTMTNKHDNILDGALNAGVDVPFACKGGVCGTCKCKVVEGSVNMKVNYALEQDEIDKNLVLSCQSVPTSERVKVDFDV
jgi:ring-1,2-phenylacetyl-CoA epoxidase subunit PaaE